MDGRSFLEDRHVDQALPPFLLLASHIPMVAHEDIYVAPIMLLEIDMLCLEMQLGGCPRGVVGAQVCHSHMYKHRFEERGRSSAKVFAQCQNRFC